MERGLTVSLVFTQLAVNEMVTPKNRRKDWIPRHRTVDRLYGSFQSINISYLDGFKNISLYLIDEINLYKGFF